MNRLIDVVQGRKTVRSYAYDAFGNRIEKRDYTGEQPLHTTYQYNVKNQLIEEYRNDTLETAKEYKINPFDTIKKYSYDGRGNLTKIMQDETLQRQFEFDETNQLRASFEMQGDITKAARYTYNGLGQRVGQETYAQQMEESLQPLSKIDFAKLQPENRFSYLLDITKDYNNLLERTDAVSGKSQQFFWDTNVISMQEDGEDNFYLQDALGSVMNLTDKQGNSLERYEFDEFGVPIAGTKSASRQPFAFTGYQMDAVGGMYFAQARRYDANAGRFISEDKIRGTIAAPFTMNHYGYCWNRPVDFVDWDGLSPEQPEFLKKGNEAHTLLQEKFMRDYGGKGGQVEYSIKSGISTNISGRGRADIVYFNSGTRTVEVYEIKPGSYALGAIYHAVGLAQLDRYVYALNNNGQIVNGWNAITGVSLQKDPRYQSIIIPSIEYPNQEIVYKIYQDGIITYYYRKKKEQPETEPATVEEEEQQEDFGKVAIEGLSFATIIALLAKIGEGLVALFEGIILGLEEAFNLMFPIFVIDDYYEIENRIYASKENYPTSMS